MASLCVFVTGGGGSEVNYSATSSFGDTVNGSVPVDAADNPQKTNVDIVNAAKQDHVAQFNRTWGPQDKFLLFGGRT